MSTDLQTDLPRRFRALVVDDERDFRHLMTVFLQRSGMPIDVVAVGTGAEAVVQLHGADFDIVLLDVMMPEMDGFEVCRRMRADNRLRGVPILMLTALDEATDRTRGFLAGTDDYLAKPFDRGELLARVRRILQRTYGYGDGGEAAAPRPKTSRAPISSWRTLD
ncbi:MAG: response regulator [Deltaproteobacteria bacterium]|nr:response regulator [Deltaproteobacteria bacterium]